MGLYCWGGDLVEGGALTGVGRYGKSRMMVLDRLFIFLYVA